jgi:hypothetical protein
VAATAATPRTLQGYRNSPKDCEMRDSIAQCQQAVRSGGLAEGLALALEGAADRSAPGSVTALPAGLVPAGAALVRHQDAEAERIWFVRIAARQAADDAELTAIGARLGAARLGLTSQLLDHVVTHVSSRTSWGEPIIRKQLVAGALADARLAIETTRRCLQVAGHHRAVVADAHDRITRADWELARLLGASGYIGPGLPRQAFVSRLIANCWVRRKEAP